MIEVSIKHDGRELARIKIEHLGPGGDFSDYSIQFGVDTAEGFAVYQRAVEHFPRRKFNALALLRIALATLEEKELSLDADPDARRSSSLARRLNRSMWPF